MIDGKACAFSNTEPRTIRGEDETLDDYAVRLYLGKKTYGLNSWDIAELLNKEAGTAKDESAWRKYYTGFINGIRYAVHNSMEDTTSILALSDFHYPFSLPVSTFARYVGVDVLVLNGDIMDCQSISKFPKTYRIPMLEEMIGARQYMIDLITYLNPKTVYITIGNHEARLGSYLANKLDTDMIELMPNTAMDYIVTDGFYHYDKRQRAKAYYEPLISVFSESDTEIKYDGDWKCRVGKTIFAHPLAFSSAMMKTTEKALNFFFRTEQDFDTVVLGHTHQLGYYPQGDVNMYEQGTCSDTEKLDYTNGRLTNPQQKGCLYLVQRKDGSLDIDKTKLIKF